MKSGSKINTIYPNFAKKLVFQMHKIELIVQKINYSKLNMFEMIISYFFIKNKQKKFCFFEKIFLLTNVRKKLL